MNVLCQGALTFLERVYCEEQALFPFSTRLEDGEYRSTYDSAGTIRYSINCLLGLTAAARNGFESPLVRAVDDLTQDFLRHHQPEVVDPGDQGLMTVLLSDERYGSEALAAAMLRVQDIVSEERRMRHLNLQQLSWLLWGALAADGRGHAAAEPIARHLWSTILSLHSDDEAALPRHDLRLARKRMVSFGASVYFLHVAYQYARRFEDAAALSRFDRGALSLLRAQGPHGEWPWLLTCAHGRPLDFYPVFSVHQTSMAMLVLFPALERALPGTQTAIDRSLTCITSANQLGLPMWQRDPFYIYRSIERKAPLPRVERYLRAARRSLSDQPAGLAADDRLRFNTESRSYEMGWILYLLSSSKALPALESSSGTR